MEKSLKIRNGEQKLSNVGRIGENCEEPVSEDLDKELDKYIKENGLDGFDTIEEAKCLARHFANWQKKQMEAYRIKHCKSITNEQAELEDNFVSSHVEKNNRIPTFIDAIEYGIEYGKQEMMKDAVEGGCFSYRNGYKHISCDIDEHLTDIKLGDKVKLIILKEK